MKLVPIIKALIDDKEFTFADDGERLTVKNETELIFDVDWDEMEDGEDRLLNELHDLIMKLGGDYSVLQEQELKSFIYETVHYISNYPLQWSPK
ncbi:MAG: hypothetical protein KAR40_06180 [Candidatus Sabulitectum sp.]|nr:hypothetical protein [Candidatus Sabulitectum sp.]